jgi:hypothetical protein
LVWQIIAEENSWIKHKEIIVYLGIICVVLTVVLLFFPLEPMAESFINR